MNAQQVLAAAPGLTYEQLSRWTKLGYLHADDTTRTSWHAHEASIARVMLRLRKHGFSLQTAARAARGQSLGDGIKVSVEPDAVAQALPIGRLAELLAAGTCHSLTRRGGRYILDGYDVSGEYPIVVPAAVPS